MMMDVIGQHMLDIKDPLLGQTLILSPDVNLGMVTEALQGCGLTPDGAESGLDASPGAVPLSAGFAAEGQTPRAIFSGNPIVSLAILDVALCPPALRRRIAAALPVIDGDTVEDWAADTDERIALRGFWAAVETERVDLIGPITARQQEANRLIANEAARAGERLHSIDASRMTVLGGMGMIAKAAIQTTQALANPAHVGGFLATSADLSNLLTPDILDGIGPVPAEIYPRGRAMPILPAKDEDSIFAAAGGLFRDYNMLTRPFPMAFHDVAPWLLPGVIWIAWQGEDPQHGRISYDGLAFTGTRWVFCPRPYRLILGALPPETAAFVGP